MSRLRPSSFTLRGGIRDDISEVILSEKAPGALVDAVNYESDLDGGYRRINGKTKYDSAAVPGSGSVEGCWLFNGGVVATRDGDFYESAGNGWTKINTTTRTGINKVRGHKFNWTRDVLFMVDGENYPVVYEPGATTEFREIADASVNKASCAHEFKNYMFLGVGSKVVFSAPNNYEDYDAANGAGEVNVGFKVMALYPWRDQLYVFGLSNIVKITGSTFGGNSPDIVLSPVTDGIGLLAADSIVELGGNLFYLSNDGVRTIAGTEQIGDVELASVSSQIQDRVTEIYNTYRSGYITALPIRRKSQYRLLTYTPSIGAGDTRGILGSFRGSPNTTADSWEWFEIRGVQAVNGDTDYEDDTEVTIIGSPDGYVYKLDDGNDWDGTAINSSLALPTHFYGDMARRKILHKVDVEVEIEGNFDLTMTTTLDPDKEDVVQPAPYSLKQDTAGFAIFDDPDTIFDDSTTIFSSSPKFDGRKNAEGSFDSMQFTFYSEDSNPPHTLRSITTWITQAGHD